MMDKQVRWVTYGLLMVLVFAMILFSCKKTSSTNASVLFYNGTWSAAAISAAWNGNPVISAPLTQGQSSGSANTPYVQVPAGTNLVTLKAGTDILADKNLYTPASAGISILFYDTSASAGAKVNILEIADDLSVPDTASIKYRFIDLSPDTAVTADLWLVNGVTDSIQLATGAVFIGKTALASSVEAFAVIKYHGEGYTIKIKKTGTEELYASVPGYFFAVRGVYSIIFSGLSTGTGSTGFKLSVLHHFTQ